MIPPDPRYAQPPYPPPQAPYPPPQAPYAPVFPPPYPPGYAPAPVGPYPYAYPYAYPYPPPPPLRTAKPSLAAAFWVILLIRDIGFLGLTAIVWFETQALGFQIDNPFALIDDPAVMVGTLVVGLAASAVALVSDLTRTNHMWGLYAGAVATVCCATPGILFGFGIVGACLGAIAVVLHFVSRGEFTSRPPAEGASAAPSAP